MNSEQQATHHATTIPSKHNFLLYAPFKHVCSDQEVNIMQIFVGQNAYQVEASTSIDTLKAMIENKEFIPAQFIRLVNGASAIEGGTLAGNGIEEDDSIAMVYDALAGMRAKWRKKRMRRLRRKRRKMRQRAR